MSLCVMSRLPWPDLQILSKYYLVFFHPKILKHDISHLA